MVWRDFDFFRRMALSTAGWLERSFGVREENGAREVDIVQGYIEQAGVGDLTLSRKARQDRRYWALSCTCCFVFLSLFRCVLISVSKFALSTRLFRCFVVDQVLDVAARITAGE